MNASEAKDFICKTFEDAWVGVGLDPTVVKYDDVPGQKPAGDVPWARVNVQHADGNQSSLAGGNGTRRFRNVGTVIVQVFTPIGDGSVAEYDVGQAVLNAYRTARHTNLWFKGQRLREVPSDGMFAQTNVLAEFTYDDVI